MGCEPDLLCGRPCDLPGCAASTNPSLSFCPPLLPLIDIEEEATCVSSRPTAGSPRIGSPSHRRAVRARHGDAHPKRRQAASNAAEPQSQNLRFSSSSPAPTTTLPQRRKILRTPLTFVHPPGHGSEG